MVFKEALGTFLDTIILSLAIESVGVLNEYHLVSYAH